jgi:integrase
VKGEEIDAWYSGKAHRHGGNVQAVRRPDGLPLWAGPPEPGSAHEITPTAPVHLPADLTKARAAIGLPDLHFHGLRHRGNTMAAGRGAGLRELMERMGHSSTRAALTYQHATQERDVAIAAGMGELLWKAWRNSRAGGGVSKTRRSGTQPARSRKRAS